MIISEGFADSEHRHLEQEAFQHIKNITGTVLLFTELPKFKMISLAGCSLIMKEHSLSSQMCHITNEVEPQSYTALHHSQTKAAGCGPVIFHSKVKAHTSWTKYIERCCVYGNECRAKWGCFFCCCGSGVGTVHSANTVNCTGLEGQDNLGTKTHKTQI